MAIIVNSKFKPFSFQEMLQPVAMAAQMHQALEEQYGELDKTSSVWKKLEHSKRDSDVYYQYKNYYDALKAASDELAQYGLNPSSRRTLLDLRARYSKEITPIEQAWNERDRQIKLQQEMMLKDPTHMYRIQADKVGLRKYMDTEGFNALSDNYSGALLTQQASTIAANLKQVLTDKGKLKSLGLPYQYERELQYGYTPEQVDAAVRGDKDASPILRGIIEKVLQGSGMSKWDNFDTLKDKVMGYIGQGIYNAIGTTKLENFKDDFSMQDALNARQFARQQKAKEDEKKEQAKLAINPHNIYTPEEVEKMKKAGEFAKYFKKNPDGTYSITNAGLKEYNKQIRSATPIWETAKKSSNPFVRAVMHTPEAMLGMQHEAAMNSGTLMKSEFRKFMDGLGLKINGNMVAKTSGINNANKLFTQYMQETDKAKYDAKKRTEFGYAVSDTQAKNLKHAISTALTGEDKIMEARFDSKQGKFVATSGSLSLADLKSDKYHVTDIRFSPYGSTVFIEDDKGNTRRYMMPADINSTNETNRQQSINEALAYQKMLMEGSYTGKAGVTVNYSDEEQAELQRLYEEAIQKAYLYHSQLGYTNETKKQEFEPYGY